MVSADYSSISSGSVAPNARRRFLPLSWTYLMHSLFAIILVIGAQPPYPQFPPKLTFALVFVALGFLINSYISYAKLPRFSQDVHWAAHPPFWCLAWAIVMFPLPALYGAYNQQLLREVGPWVTFSQEYTAWGMTLLLAGLLTMWMSFNVSALVVHPGRATSELTSRFPSQAVLLLAYMILAVLQVFLLLTVGTDYSRDVAALGPLSLLMGPIATFASASLLIVAFMAIGTFKYRQPILPFTAVLVLQVSFGFASGFKKPILWLGLVLLVSVIYSRIPLRRMMLPAMLLTVAAVLVVPITSEYRTVISQGESPVPALQTAYDESWGEGFGHGIQIFMDDVVGRQSGVAQMPGLIMQKTPDSIPYLGWENMLAIPTLLIPRALWPEKPVVTQGISFSHEYLNYPAIVESSSAPTVFGEAYMFAGWPSALLAGVVLGALLACIYRLIIEAGLVALGISLLPTVIDLENQFSAMSIGLIQNVVVFSFVTFLVFRAMPARHPSGVHSASGTRLNPDTAYGYVRDTDGAKSYPNRPAP